MVIIVLLGAAVLAIAWGVLIYNSLVRARTVVEEAWSGIDVQLKRRHDLVPNLVETVRGYAAHEQRVLLEVTNARAAARAAADPGERAAAEHTLSVALGKVNAVAEAYPELRAAEPFLDLQRRLAEVESDIAAARRIYNDDVQRYNSAIATVPNNIVARGHFLQREFFELDSPAERLAPAVAFGR